MGGAITLAAHGSLTQREGKDNACNDPPTIGGLVEPFNEHEAPGLRLSVGGDPVVGRSMASPRLLGEGRRVRIGGYVAGNAITSGICALAVTIGLVVLRVPFAIPLGIWAGFADLIPMVGSYAGAIPAIVIAFFVSPMTGLLTALFFVAHQQFENYVLVPRVMKNAVHLSIAAVIVSTLIGATLAGFAGALLALPVAATIKVIVIEIWLKDRAREGDALARKNLREIQRQEGT